MSRKSLLKSESAAAVAIAAVLLLGLAFTIISVVKLNYAPEWKIDAEKDYSYDAWSNMEDVKTRADIFTWFMISDINYPGGLSATVPFSMGGGDVPVFEPSKSNSKLAVNTEKCTISITLPNHTQPYTVDCGGITYYSENRQYPNQVFRYENGALILAQGENSQMKRDPLFNITEDMGNYTVTFNAINLAGEPTSVSSSTSTSLRLTGCSIGSIVNTDPKADGVIDSFNLSISTHYTDAWANYFNNTAKGAGFVYGTDYTIESIPEDHVCISFLPTGNNYSIYANQTILCAELGRKVEGGTLPGGSGNVMKLNQWYNFNKVSDSNNVDLNRLEANVSGLDLSKTGTGEKLEGYSSSSYYSHNLNNPLNLKFGFNGFTEFKPNSPNSVTLVMIYQPTFTNPLYKDMNMNIAGKKLDKLGGSVKDTWYLYNQTVIGISISDPSNLTFDLEINDAGGNGKNINIDYLAVYLS